MYRRGRKGGREGRREGWEVKNMGYVRKTKDKSNREMPYVHTATRERGTVVFIGRLPKTQKQRHKKDTQFEALKARRT